MIEIIQEDLPTPKKVKIIEKENKKCSKSDDIIISFIKKKLAKG